MIAFIKNCSLQNLRIKLAILYFLNVTDLICTLLLLSTGLYIEGNSIMAEVIKYPLLTLVLKLILPVTLLIILYFRMHRATKQQLKKSNSLINITTAIYALINISHFIWFLIIPIFFY